MSDSVAIEPAFTELDGCPCSGTCCTKPDVFTTDCTCEDFEGPACECCWNRECETCGNRCGCDV